MITVEFNINKRLVYNEVAKATSYIGKNKMTAEDEGAYERVFASDADRLMLENYWNDAADRLTGRVRLFLTEVSTSPASDTLQLDNNYYLKLTVSDEYNPAMTDSIQTGMFNYFVESIIYNWLTLQNDDDAKVHAAQAVILLQELTDRLYSRKRPQRETEPEPNNDEQPNSDDNGNEESDTDVQA